jgi:mannose-1-phosphate guanylyltransferase
MPRHSDPSAQRPPRAALDHAFALILAGGSGTRFWPLSRRSRPKQLLKLFGKESLLRQTAARIRPLIPPERTYVFAHARIAGAVRRELPEIAWGQIVAEPASRNTAPAIGLAAWEVARRDPHGLMVVLPSDHLIARAGVFQKAVTAGCEWAAKDGRSVVMGIQPARAETGYGYIRIGREVVRTGGMKLFRVLRFTEKPSATVARRYVQSGRYLWNAGMFIWKASTLMANLERFQERMAVTLERIAGAGGLRSSRALARLYPRLENISIDYALMEKVPEVYAVAADMGWSDVGSWAAAFDASPKDSEGNVRPAASLSIESRRNMIVSPSKFVATVGVDDLVVVETDDALLVCPRERSQDVGKLVRELERRGMQKLI